MNTQFAKKTRNTAVLAGVLLCLSAPLFDEDHDWNLPLTEKPGGPARYSNRTRNIRQVPAVYGRRNKRPREIIQPAQNIGTPWQTA